jgi:Fe-Mn family superoxide dismutase
MHTLTRRQWLRTACAGTAALALSPPPARAADGFTLPPLPYPTNALEPHIDAKTMEIHHGRHHKAYVDNLNKALAGTDWLTRPIDEVCRNLEKVPANVRTAVRNNGGGHYNHSMFWEIMGPGAGGEPTGRLGAAIKSTFGDFAKFRDQFKAAAMGRFGSGWAWLVSADGKLAIESTPNQDNPLMQNKTPVLGIDVWEHAYYLKFQNNRGGYVDAWWNVVNWAKAAQRLAQG